MSELHVDFESPAVECGTPDALLVARCKVVALAPYKCHVETMLPLGDGLAEVAERFRWQTSRTGFAARRANFLARGRAMGIYHEWYLVTPDGKLATVPSEARPLPTPAPTRPS